MSLRALLLCFIALVGAAPALSAEAAPQSTNECSGLPSAERVKCLQRLKGTEPDAPSKERVGEGGGGGDEPSAPSDPAVPTDCGTGSPCVSTPMALLGCELCTPACKLGGTIGGVTGAVLGFATGAAVGWFFLTAETDPVDQRIGEVASTGLIGAIALGATGLVVGAATGWAVGAFSPGEPPPAKKKKAPVKKSRTKR